MYLTSLPGALKVIIVVIGFIAVNIGTSAVLNSSLYIKYQDDYLKAHGNLEPDAHAYTTVCSYLKAKLDENEKSLESNKTHAKEIKGSVIALTREIERKKEQEKEKPTVDEMETSTGETTPESSTTTTPETVTPTNTAQGPQGRRRRAVTQQSPKEVLDLEKALTSLKINESVVMQKVTKLDSEMDDLEMKRRSVCDSRPSWMLQEYVFIGFGIFTLVMSLTSLVMGIVMDDELVLDDRIRAVDGVVHGFLGVLIFIGSVCLLSGMQTRLDDDGFLAKYPESSVLNKITMDDIIFYIKLDRETLDYENMMYSKEFENRKNEIEKAGKGKVAVPPNNTIESKYRTPASKLVTKNEVETAEKLNEENYEQQKVKLSVHEREVKRTINFNEKITASVFGFINSILYTFSSGLIARGVMNIPMK